MYMCMYMHIYIYIYAYMHVRYSYTHDCVCIYYIFIQIPSQIVCLQLRSQGSWRFPHRSTEAANGFGFWVLGFGFRKAPALQAAEVLIKGGVGENEADRASGCLVVNLWLGWDAHRFEVFAPSASRDKVSELFRCRT